jgi:hypothetical protein
MYSVEKQVALIALEQRILRAICAGRIPREAQDEMMRELLAHDWWVPEHRIVWDAFMRIPRAETTLLRELLPAEATRMGFPDVNWELYFAADCASPEELRALVRRLLEDAAEIK